MRMNIKNTEKISSAIIEVERRATIRRITISDIEDALKEIEKRLSCLLRKKDWVGLAFHCDINAQSFPAAYKYIPDSTQFKIERGATGWFITGLYRASCGGPSQRITPLNISEKSEQIANFVSKSKNW